MILNDYLAAKLLKKAIKQKLFTIYFHSKHDFRTLLRKNRTPTH